MSRRPPLAFIFAVTLTGILSNTLLAPLIPNILHEFGKPNSAAGLLVAVGSVAGIVVAPAVGLMADRFGRRIVLTTFLAIFGVCGGLAAIAPTFEFLLVARFFQGVGSAALVNLAVVLIGDNWRGNERTHLVGRNSSVLTVGLASMPLISGVVEELTSWRVALAIYTVAIVTSAAAWVILEDRPREHPPQVRDQVKQVLVALERPILRANLICALLVFVAIFGLVLTVLPVHLHEVFGLGSGFRGLFLAIPAVSTFLASYNLGRITSLVSPRKVVMISAVLLITAYVTIGLATALALLALAMLIYGTGEGLLIPMLQDLNLGDTPDEHRAAVMAVWVAFARLGQTIGPLLAGLAIGWFGTRITFMAGAGIGVLILLVGVFGPFPRTPAPATATQS